MSQRIYTYDPVEGLQQVGAGVPVDDAMSTTSSNPVQNKVVTAEINKAYKEDDTAETNIVDGDYVPFYDTSAGGKRKSLWSNIIAKIKSALATVATSGSYADLSNKPSNATASAAGFMSADDFKKINPQRLAQNTNLNDIRTVGWYYSPANADVVTFSNCPTSQSFYLEVGTHAGTLQRLTEYNASGTPKIYWRNFYNGSWLAWQRIYTTLDPSHDTTYSAGSNITLSGTTFSLTKANVTGALGYTPPTTNTTYSAGSNITLSGTTFSLTKANVTGALGYTPPTTNTTYSFATGDSNGQIKVTPSGGTAQNVSVKGLGSAAYTASTAYAAATHYHSGVYVPLSGNVTIADTVWCNGSLVGKTLYANAEDGTTTVVGDSYLHVGNGIAKGTAKNSYGNIMLYSQTAYCAQIISKDQSASHVLSVPALSANSTIALQSSSSYRVKENIRNMTEEEALKILDVEVVKFDYKEEFGGKTNQSGVIAEEVKEIIPEVVDISEFYDETKAIDDISNPSPTVDYGKFAPYLIKMIQIQQERIEELEQRIASLERNN